jgi:hypothetical protein
VLVAEGGAAGGYTLFVKDGKPVYEYNYFAHERYRITSSESLSPGPAVVRMDFKYDGGIGKGGTASLFINDRKVGEARIDKTCPSRFGAETFDVGMDNGSPVSESYGPPFAYGGTVKKVEIKIQPSALNADDVHQLRNATRSLVMGVE